MNRFRFPVSKILTWLPLVVILVLATGTAQAADTQTQSAKPTPIAFAARIIGNDTRFRLLVDFDKPLARDVLLLDNPKRIVVDLDETVFSLGDQLATSPSPLVDSVRFGSVAPGKSRIVISLTQPVEINRQSFQATDGGQRYRLILDVILTDPARFQSIARRDEVRLQRERSAWKGDRVRREPHEPKRFTVVLDPGHGGIDGGATGPGRTVEKHVTLAFAKAVRRHLANAPHIETLLTRETDTFVSLRERLEFARKHHAALKISIHADTVAQRNIRGATVYTLSKEGSDSLSRLLAARQNKADLVAGLSLPETEDEAADILIDLMRRETEVYSRQLARKIIASFQPKIELINNPNRSADFFVLKAPEVPSVLLEIGYLSNEQDEKQMNSPEWRDEAAKRLAIAIKGFIDAQKSR